ncbi:hypothetical protein J3Q64DRAFT_1648662 [Phycomyces blakesleeanus]
MPTTFPQTYYSYTDYPYDERTIHSQQIPCLNEFVDNENQLPTLAEFLTIIDDYLNNLSPKKRDKALVDENRYFLIQQVLKDPRNTSISTAQFRFWVKKMFTVKKGTADTVCHDNKPVAIKENIYSILVKAHQDAHHGGRDKTSALVRKQYSWIPKELVARFVRQCPFCIIRRNGGHSPGTCAPKTPSPRTGYSARNSVGFDPMTSSIFTPSISDRSEIYSGQSPVCKTGYPPSSNFPTTPNSSTLLRPFYENFVYQNNDEYLQTYSYGIPVHHSHLTPPPPSSSSHSSAQTSLNSTDYTPNQNYQSVESHQSPQPSQKKQYQIDNYLQLQQSKHYCQQPMQEWYQS